MPIVTIEKPLRDKLGDEASDSLIRLINQSQSEQKNDILEFVEEKFERRLSEEIGKVNERISEEIGKVNKRINEVEGGLLAKISETNSKISEAKSEMIKWMFIFWVGQIGVILGILFAFFK